MDITFIGVGEAFDERLPNCSALVESRNPDARLLLDCGFSAPFSYWRLAQRPLDLDAVWISHFHGDHFLGLPALLLRFWEEGREKTLRVVGRPGVEDTVCRAMDLAYPGVRQRFGFELAFHQVDEGDRLDMAGLALAFARSEHPSPNLSVRVDNGRASLFYSGDGRPTPATLELARGVDLAVHESFSLEPDTPGHGTVPGSIALAREAGVARLALVHLRRDVRHGRAREVARLMAEADGPEVLLPLPGDKLRLAP